MIICHQHGLVYLPPPKTGSSTLLTVLTKPPWHGIITGGTVAHHGFEWSEQIRNYFFFITVRHPYTRMYSLWKMIVNNHRVIRRRPHMCGVFGQWLTEHWPTRPPTLDEFLDDPAIQCDFRGLWRCSWHLEQLPDNVHGTVVKQEKFQKDLRKIPQFQAYYSDDYRWPLINGGRSRCAWHEVMTDKHCEKVQKLWDEDFDRFGYNRKRKAVIVLNK